MAPTSSWQAAEAAASLAAGQADAEAKLSAAAAQLTAAQAAADERRDPGEGEGEVHNCGGVLRRGRRPLRKFAISDVASISNSKL